MPTPVTTLIYGALAEIRVARGGDVVRADDQALCLTFLNEVLERLAVTPHAVYAVRATQSDLVPGQSAYFLGPTGLFLELPVRPVRIHRAWVFLPDGRPVPIPSQSVAWMTAHAVPYLTGPIPEGYWYNPEWPNGELYFGPVPSMPYSVALELAVTVSTVAISDTIDLPQGYSELLRLWTAKKAAPSFARDFSSASQAALTECLSEIFGTNIPRVNDADTRDGGVPGGRGGVYDYRTGQVS